MRIPFLLTDRHIDDPPSPQLLRQQVLHVDDGLTVVARRFPHLGEFGLGFGSHGEDVPARGADARCEGLQLFEVGLAEGAPVAAVDCQRGVRLVWVCKVGREDDGDRGDGAVERRTDDEDEVGGGADFVVALDGVGDGGDGHC